MKSKNSNFDSKTGFFECDINIKNSTSLAKLKGSKNNLSSKKIDLAFLKNNIYNKG